MAKRIPIDPNNVPTAPAGVQFSQTSAVECEDCGHPRFQQVMLMRRLSSIVSPTSQEEYIPIGVFECTKCHALQKNMLPPEIKEEIDE